ncbi:MAG: CDP-glycerol glycerophosphotransferase family protein [bacterium]|nr:CDP-glycerol glycerophosphotransferase family protein [bacterium]
MRTIVIPSFHSLVSRNILTAPFFDLLKQSGYTIVIVVPEKKKDFFEKHYGGPAVIVHGLVNRLTRLDAFFKTFALAALKTRSILIMRKRGMGIEHPLLFRLLRPFASATRPLIPILYKILMPKNTLGEIFERYRAHAVFSTDVFSANDCRIMLEAKRRGIPVVGMVRSWDNLTAKGGFRVVPDVVVLQNEIQQKEAQMIHGINKNRMRIVGIPHYDRYVNGPTKDRDAFLKDLGIKTSAKYFVYGPIGDRIVKVGDSLRPHTYDRNVIEYLDKRLPSGCYLVVRTPPTDTVNLDGYIPSSRVIIEQPGTRFGEGKSVRMTELTRSDDDHLVNLLYHSAGVVTVFSSLCIDGLVLGKPVALLAFDFNPASYWESVKRLHEFDHMVPVLESGVCDVLESASALDAFILRSREEGLKNNLERQRFMDRECFHLDGKSSQRLYELIEKNITSDDTELGSLEEHVAKYSTIR